MTTVLLRTGAAFVALGCLALAVFLAGHYPMFPAGVATGVVLWSLAVFMRPGLWLLAVPALLPVIGLASWTGWLTFEELDMLVLGAAAGGYASIAVHSFPQDIEGRDRARLSIFALVAILAVGITDALGLHRGLAATGDFQFGWFHGYGDALNSLRLFKSFPLAVLLLPLVVVALRRSPQRATDLLAAGLTVGLGGAALAVLWERLAFTNLLDFSTDYRATGLFWEMHVGGAALDGFLALTIPFAAWQLVRAAGPKRLVVGAALAGLASYACLATFSRGLYVAVLVSLLLMAVILVFRGQGAFGRPSIARTLKWMLATFAAAVAAVVVFRAGGYRSLIAVLAVVAVTLPLGRVVRPFTWRSWLVAFVLGGFLGTTAAFAGQFVDKGPYVIFGLVFAASGWAIWRHRSRGDGDGGQISLSAYIGLIIAAANVALYWGGWRAFLDATGVLAGVLLLTIWNARSMAPLWPETFRAQTAILGAAVLMAGVVAVFSGGAYMSGRFASIEQDFAGRMWHWSDSLRMMKSDQEWLLGRGAGRFPADFARHVPSNDVPGGYRVTTRDGRTFLALSGPGQPVGSAQLLRVAQRVAIVPGEKFVVVLEVRAQRDAALLVEICEKNLLYGQGCANSVMTIKSSDERWQRVIVPLDGKELSGGHWYAPRPVFFSVAVDSPQTVVEIGQASVIGSDGRNLIDNGDWSAGMTFWFFTSDRQHLPWHIKNLPLHVLFDQGVVGLLSFSLMVGCALWRVIGGAARHHPIAPAFAASLVGFLVVGCFDSLLDVPRVAFLFYLIALTGMVLPRREDSPEYHLPSL